MKAKRFSLYAIWASAFLWSIYTSVELYNALKDVRQDVVVADKYQSQYRGTITNYIEICSVRSSICEQMPVRRLSDWQVGSKISVKRPELRDDGVIAFTGSLAAAIIIAHIAALIGMFINWIIEDENER